MAETEQQLADTLDRAAKRLNGADAGGAKGDTRRLADQLDQARDARDRLARLEKQIQDKEAESKQPGVRAVAVPAVQRRREPGVSADSQGEGQSGGDLERLKDDYARAVQQSKALLDRLQRGTPDSGRNMSTPEDHRVEPLGAWHRGVEAGLREVGRPRQGRHAGARTLRGQRCEQAVARVDGRSAPRRCQRPRA